MYNMFHDVERQTTIHRATGVLPKPRVTIEKVHTEFNFHLARHCINGISFKGFGTRNPFPGTRPQYEPVTLRYEVEIVSGSEWVGLDQDEDGALDDMSFLEPVPRATPGVLSSGG